MLPLFAPIVLQEHSLLLMVQRHALIAVQVPSLWSRPQSVLIVVLDSSLEQLRLSVVIAVQEHLL